MEGHSGLWLVVYSPRRVNKRHDRTASSAEAAGKLLEHGSVLLIAGKPERNECCETRETELVLDEVVERVVSKASRSEAFVQARELKSE